MKTIASIILSAALVTSAFAGSASYSKNPVIQPQQETLCFGPGFDFGIFGGGFLPRHKSDDYDNALGGGALAEYFFNENFGIQVSYGAYATSSVQHLFNADLILRAPIHSMCIAPYVMVGGGYQVDGEKLGEYHAGVGVECKVKSMQNLGVFLDGAYYWHSSSDRDRDFTLVRLGVKFHL